jgi:mannose-6-phosphate isomerase-like protein (cupin superfamily)
MASGHLTGNTLSFIDQLCDGGGPGVHMHPSDEGLYVVSGHCSFHAGGANLSAGAGSLVFVPRFTEHAFSVDASDTHLLNFYLPAGFEMFVMGVAHPAERNELPRMGEVAMPPERLVEQLSADYGQLAAGGLPVRGVGAPETERMVTRPNPDAVVQPFLATADESRHWWYDGQLWSVLADGARTDECFCMFDIVAPRGTGARPHLFVEADAFYYILDGAVDMLLGHEVKTAGKGDFVFVPKGTPHARRVVSEQAHLLHLRTPAGFERILAVLGEPTEADAAPAAGRSAGAFDEIRARQMFDDLGLRTVTMTDPFAAV